MLYIVFSRVRIRFGGWCKSLRKHLDNGGSKALLNNQPVLDLVTSPWKVRASLTHTCDIVYQPHPIPPGNILYTLHEVSSTLISQQIPAAPNGTSPIISNLSIVPQDAPQNATFAAAEILFPTPNTAFPGRYVYVSNRNIGPTFDPRGDSIAVFAAAGSGELTLVRHVFTGLQQIRGMQFGGVDNKFLIAGANTQGGVAMFERTGDGGDLNLLATNLELQNRTSFAFLEDVESVDEPVGDGESTEEGRLVTVSSAPTGVQNGEPQPQADNQTVASDSSAPTAQAWLSTVMAQVLLLAMIFTLA